MTDTEKKIAEIREALEKATPGPWEIVDIGGIEIARDYKYKNGKHSACWIAEMYQDEDMDEDQVYADARLIANAPEWLGFLLDELERLEREYAEERAAHNAHVTELCELEQEAEQREKLVECLREVFYERLKKEAEQREKLIECLRFYERLACGREVNDGGRRARTLLSEIGAEVMQHESR